MQIAEIGMFQSLFGRDSFLGQIAQHFEQQVDEQILFFDGFEQFFEVDSFELPERVEKRRIKGHFFFVLCYFFPGHRPQNPKNSEQLIAFGLSLEDRGQKHQLSQDAANGPNIDGRRVLGKTQHKLWGSVVPADDVGRVFAVGIDDFTAAEVAYFDGSLFGQQHVLGFQVAMSDILAVDVFEPIEQLVGVILNVVSSVL